MRVRFEVARLVEHALAGALDRGRLRRAVAGHVAAPGGVWPRLAVPGLGGLAGSLFVIVIGRVPLRCRSIGQTKDPRLPARVPSVFGGSGALALVPPRSSVLPPGAGNEAKKAIKPRKRAKKREEGYVDETGGLDRAHGRGDHPPSTTTATRRRSCRSNRPNVASRDALIARRAGRRVRAVYEADEASCNPVPDHVGIVRSRSIEPVGALRRGRARSIDRWRGGRSGGPAGSPGRRRCRASGRPRAAPASRCPRRSTSAPQRSARSRSVLTTSSEVSRTAPPWTSERSILTMSKRSWLSSRRPALPAPTSSAARRMPGDPAGLDRASQAVDVLDGLALGQLQDDVAAGRGRGGRSSAGARGR